MSDNTITLVGNLTRDPELRFTTTGRGVASFGIAVGLQLEIAKMNMLVLKISAEGGAQQEEGDSTGTSAAVSRMREVAMQMLQFPVPSGCFAPCLIMKDTYVIMMVDVERR